MASSVPKSYQATIKYPPSGPAGPASPGPTGPGPAGPAPITYPHIYTNKMFQVPAGKTWQVLKMMVRVPVLMTNATIIFYRIEKATSDGVEQMVLQHNTSVGVIEEGLELNQFRDLVFEDEEIIRQLVKVSGSQDKFTMQYEMSVMELTP